MSNKNKAKENYIPAYCILIGFILVAILILYISIDNFKQVERLKYLYENGWEITGTIIDFEEQTVPYSGGDRPGFSYVYRYQILYEGLQGESKIFYHSVQTNGFKDEYGKEMVGTTVLLFMDDRGSVELAERVDTKYIDTFWFCVIGIIVALGFMIAVAFAARSIMRQK